MGLHLLGKWSREEALASAFDAVIVELPTGATSDRDELGIDHEIGLLERYITRWGKHLAELKNVTPYALVQSFLVNNTMTSNVPLQSDQHGFRKLIIFLTPRKLVAMDSVSGDFIWTRYFDFKVSKAGISRDSHVAVPPLINLIGSENGNVVITTLDALTGSFFESDGAITSFGTAKQVLQTTIVDPTTHRIVYAIISDTIKLYPTNKDIENSFSKMDFYYFLVESTGIRGFVVENKDIKSTYHLLFPQDEVLETFYHQPVGNVASLGRVVGRDVLFKYLNSNLGVFITLKEGKGTALYVYLVDVVSGTIHAKIAHYGAGNAQIGRKGQVHVTKSENVVIYTFWNHGTTGVDPDLFPSLQKEILNEDGSKKKRKRIGTPSKHQEIVVLELFESSIFNKRVESPVYSSFSNDRISTIGQSFVLQETVNGLGITTTGNGITSKEILVAYEVGVHGIPRKVLDARRPIGTPSSTDKEDSLLPYQAAIPKNPLDIMTYFKDIRVSKLKTVQTGLESTSLVIGFKGDILVTKRTPSGAFDTLSEDFGYYQIIAALFALSVGLFVAKQVVYIINKVRRKEIKEAWN
jgi:ER membrane protein complex subunit 1